jgi:hypothetical protein
MARLIVGLADQLEVVLGQLPGGLDRLAAAGGEEHPVQVARSVAGDPLGELDGVGMGVGPQRHEGQLLGLLGGGLGQLNPTVSELAHEQAGEAVEVALAVGVEQVGTFAAHDDRNIGRLVAGVPGEMHPQVVACRLLEVGVVVDGVVLTGHGYRSSSWGRVRP